MGEETEKLESIKINSKKTIEMFLQSHNIELKYDKESVQFIDNFIENSGRKFSEDQQFQLVNILGSFFGDCIRENYGGKWELVDGYMGVRLESDDVMFPFRKMQKQLDGGEGDTIFGFYEMIPMLKMIKRKRAEAKK